MILTTKPIKGSGAKWIYPNHESDYAMWKHCVGVNGLGLCWITVEQFYAEGLDKVLANHTTFTIEDE